MASLDQCFCLYRVQVTLSVNGFALAQIMTTTQELHDKFEPHPDTEALTGNVKQNVDYTPHPEKSLNVSPEHKSIVDSIVRLYSGSSNESDMNVYDEKAIYDDPYSYCDTRYKIAGQWYGLPKIFSGLEPIATEVVSDKPDEIIFKLRHKYTLRGVKVGKEVDSLVSLSLDEAGKVKYHKDQWNGKDYSHDGLGKLIKKANGDYLTGITKPPESL